MVSGTILLHHWWLLGQSFCISDGYGVLDCRKHGQVSSPASHFDHRFSAPSSKLYQNWLQYWKGTLYLHATVHRCCLCPPQSLDTIKTVETSCRSIHINTRTGQQKKFSRLKQFWFYLCWPSNRNCHKKKEDIIWAYCHLSTNTKQSISQQFSKTSGVISGSGWRKVAVNKCLEFEPA